EQGQMVMLDGRRSGERRVGPSYKMLPVSIISLLTLLKEILRKIYGVCKTLLPRILSSRPMPT
ncbi:hypothetical protein RSAG8_10956, partial [Rhizoctonia solani AG-8 WAC10335]